MAKGESKNGKLEDQPDYADIEHDYHEAEKRLIERLGIKRTSFGHIDDEHLREMSKAFSKHAMENRRLLVQNGNLQRQLHGAEHGEDKQLAQIRAAAAARAEIAATAMREFKKLLPTAIAQAKKGKPALLRMILRASR